MGEAKRKTIGLDFDDVLMDFNDALNKYHNHHHGTNLDRSHNVTFDLWEVWACTPEEATNRVLSFYLSDHHHAAMPVAGAQEAIQKLGNNYDFVIITSRPEHIKTRTLEWFEKHYPNFPGHICFTNLFAGGDRKKKSKAEACAEFGVSVFIDDNLDNVTGVAESGVASLLFDNPWNQTAELHPNVTRVRDWNHILEILKA